MQKNKKRALVSQPKKKKIETLKCSKIFNSKRERITARIITWFLARSIMGLYNPKPLNQLEQILLENPVTKDRNKDFK